jgi:RNA ligase (TIGR02306 family)
MSTVNVKVSKVEISAHPNANKLEIATIGGEGGFVAIVGKDQFKTGDLALFIPENSVVPENIRIFLTTSQKIEVKEGRIRCTKIRGVFSDGLCLTPSAWLPAELIKEDQDVTEFLGVTKYEPPPPRTQSAFKSKGINHHYTNENFKKFTDIESFKKYPRNFIEGEEVVATVKYHGTNFRCGYVKRPKKSYTRWEKVKSFFGFKIPDMESLVGSHNTIRQKSKRGTDVADTYWRVADKYKIREITKELSVGQAEVTIFGEIIGPGIQTGYDYGIPQGELELRVFAIMVNGEYLDWDAVVSICSLYYLPTVEVAYRGPWSMAVIKLAEAVDTYNGKKFIREGIVIVPVKERKYPGCGRVILKYVSETFKLDKKNSEFH